MVSDRVEGGAALILVSDRGGGGAILTGVGGELLRFGGGGATRDGFLFSVGVLVADESSLSVRLVPLEREGLTFRGRLLTLWVTGGGVLRPLTSVSGLVDLLGTLSALFTWFACCRGAGERCGLGLGEGGGADDKLFFILTDGELPTDLDSRETLLGRGETGGGGRVLSGVSSFTEGAWPNKAPRMFALLLILMSGEGVVCGGMSWVGVV